MAACRSTMERKTPRRRRLRVRAEKKFSTALSQELEVGVKWKVQRGWRMSQAWTLGCLWGCVIVDNGVDQLASRDRAFDGVEEADELLMGMLLHAATEHHAVEHVEGGEQGGRAVALVIVCHGPALAGFERPSRRKRGPWSA